MSIPIAKFVQSVIACLILLYNLNQFVLIHFLLMHIEYMLCVRYRSKVLAPKDAELVEDVANNENVKAGKTALKKDRSEEKSL